MYRCWRYCWICLLIPFLMSRRLPYYVEINSAIIWCIRIQLAYTSCPNKCKFFYYTLSGCSMVFFALQDRTSRGSHAGLGVRTPLLSTPGDLDQKDHWRRRPKGAKDIHFHISKGNYNALNRSWIHIFWYKYLFHH